MEDLSKLLHYLFENHLNLYQNGILLRVIKGAVGYEQS